MMGTGRCPNRNSAGGQWAALRTLPYKRIVELLGVEPGIRPEDVLINLVEVGKENWSFGNGIASYVQ